MTILDAESYFCPQDCQVECLRLTGCTRFMYYNPSRSCIFYDGQEVGGTRPLQGFDLYVRDLDCPGSFLAVGSATLLFTIPVLHFRDHQVVVRGSCSFVARTLSPT